MRIVVVSDCAPCLVRVIQAISGHAGALLVEDTPRPPLENIVETVLRDFVKPIHIDLSFLTDELFPDIVRTICDAESLVTKTPTFNRDPRFKHG